MKTIIYKSGLLCAAAALLFAACDSDRDDNPIIDTEHMTTEFVLNTPAYATQSVDLASSSTVNFTWNQPGYGITVPVSYSFQVSADDTWNDAVVDGEGNEVTPATYADVMGSFAAVSGGVLAKQLNKSLAAVKGWTPDTPASDLPAALDIYVRCKAVLNDQSVPAVYSNSVKLKVVPTVPTIDYPEFIYQIGDDTGWATANALRSGQDENNVFTGVYTGFAYLQSEFKFREDKEVWDGFANWGIGEEEGTVAESTGNISVSEPGFYMIQMDMDQLTYSLTLISTIGVVGPAQAGGWDEDTDMTYNKETGAWEVEMELDANEFKFRANDGWDINWGDDLKNLTQDGGNLVVDAAGRYKIELFLTYQGGEGCSRAVLTKL